ncbi:MAG: hypothetical protein EBR82_02280 [Caulobacteraceae bacterium]|nr:hypothetical protein [Caulobacteraceae bacterium]
MIVAALAFATQAATPAPCLRDGDVVEGEFRYVEAGLHAGRGRAIEPFVVLNDPVCVIPSVSLDPPVVRGRWIQLGQPIGQDRPWPAPGAVIRVVVQDCHEPMTNWHIGDIFCDARLVSRVTQ